METIKKNGMDIHSFAVTDSVATMQIHIRHKNYEKAITSLLKTAQGLTVEIS